MKFTLIFLSSIVCLVSACKQPKKEETASKSTENKGIMKKNPVISFEIPVTDMARAIAFYKAVFGFDFEKKDIDGNEMAYFPIDNKASGISGSLAKGDSYKPSKNGSRLYFNVDNMDDILQKVVQNKGKILYPKTDIGEWGFVAEFEDLEGNRIALSMSK